MTKETTKWIESAYIKWRGVKRTASQRRWAEEIGVPFNTAKNWLNREQTPDADACLLLALHTGDWSIFELSGHPRPDGSLIDLARIWPKLNETTKSEIFTRALRAAGAKK